MITVEIAPKIKLDIEEILNGIAKLNTNELESFHLKVGGLLSKRKAKSIPERESELMEKITGAFLPQPESRSFELLLEKKSTATLTEEEQSAYKQLLHIVQNRSMQRLAWLVELCQLRGESIAVTMQRLGIKAVKPYNV
jgi:hypothetical protein